MNFKELREQLTDEMVKDILAQFNVAPVDETSDFIIFPTCCHNLEGGSPKLYYYKDSKLFRCFTECNATFDIFTLLQKMYYLRGQDISLRQAIEICDLDIGDSVDNSQAKAFNCAEELRYLQELNKTYIPDVENLNIKTYDTSVLNQYSFDYMGLMPWIQEGIGLEALQKFNIKYDAYHQAIIIPNFNYKGELIGVRARYFKEQDLKKGKYRPVIWNGTVYSHPTGRTFYGIWENHKNIEKKRVAVIFEGKR